MARIDRYAVMGNPIAHSKSPQIHKLFAEQTRQLLSYEAILVEIGQLAEAITDFQAQNGRGLNITVPFKRDAFHLAQRLMPRAQRAGAVNTLILHGPGLYTGDNTDGAGLVRDLTSNHGIEIKNKQLLILGAGGAVRGVLEPLLSQQPDRLVIANRTVSRAEELANDFDDLARIETCGFDELQGESFDLIINGTSASLSGQLPPLPDALLKTNSSIYDMMYGAEPTPFMQWGQQHGATTILDGLGMLVEQAAESFYLWRAVRPDTAPVIQALRNAL